MLSILLINDNKIVSRLLQLSSKKSGFDIEESGVFTPNKESYNLIFVDSDKYSDELLSKIKENLTYDKLVFIGTAQVKKPDGFELVLEKPFLPTDFTSLVEKNFIVEEEGEDDGKEEEIIDFDDIDEDINSELELDSSPENLAQMVDEIDEIDEEKEQVSQEESEDELDDDLEDIDSHEEFDLDDNLLLDEEDENLKESEEEVELPNIDNEIIEKETVEEKEEIDEVAEKKLEEEAIEDEIEDELKTEEEEPKEDKLDDELKSLDKTEMKQLIEPDEQDSEKSIEEVEELEEEILQDNENEEETNPSDLEEIVAKKLKEIITPELLQDALKGLSINITFGDK